MQVHDRLTVRGEEGELVLAVRIEREVEQCVGLWIPVLIHHGEGEEDFEIGCRIAVGNKILEGHFDPFHPEGLVGVEIFEPDVARLNVISARAGDDRTGQLCLACALLEPKVVGVGRVGGNIRAARELNDMLTGRSATEIAGDLRVHVRGAAVSMHQGALAVGGAGVDHVGERRR